MGLVNSQSSRLFESKDMKLERIKHLVEESKKYPEGKARIEYSGELPDVAGITEDNFFGVKAVYNKNVPKSTGCSIIYSY